MGSLITWSNMMKKILMTVAVLGCAASIVSAQTVSSANIVGYGKVEATGGLQLGSMQFYNGASNSVDSIFGDTYPENTSILIYDAGYIVSTYAISYPPPTYAPILGWSAGIDPLVPGQGFWIQLPIAEAGTFEIIMSGDVPLVDAVTNQIVAGLNLFSYPYPAEMEVQDLGFTPSLTDNIFVYDNAGGYTTISYAISYPPPAYAPVEGWSDPTYKIPVGAGFWYQTGAATNWVVARPFTP